MKPIKQTSDISEERGLTDREGTGQASTSFTEPLAGGEEAAPRKAKAKKRPAPAPDGEGDEGVAFASGASGNQHSQAPQPQQPSFIGHLCDYEGLCSATFYHGDDENRFEIKGRELSELTAASFRKRFSTTSPTARLLEVAKTTLRSQPAPVPVHGLKDVLSDRAVWAVALRERLRDARKRKRKAVGGGAVATQASQAFDPEDKTQANNYGLSREEYVDFREIPEEVFGELNKVFVKNTYYGTFTYLDLLLKPSALARRHGVEEIGSLGNHVRELIRNKCVLHDRTAGKAASINALNLDKRTWLCAMRELAVARRKALHCRVKRHGSLALGERGVFVENARERAASFILVNNLRWEDLCSPAFDALDAPAMGELVRLRVRTLIAKRRKKIPGYVLPAREVVRLYGKHARHLLSEEELLAAHEEMKALAVERLEVEPSAQQVEDGELLPGPSGGAVYGEEEALSAFLGEDEDLDNLECLDLSIFEDEDLQVPLDLNADD